MRNIKKEPSIVETGLSTEMNETKSDEETPPPRKRPFRQETPQLLGTPSWNNTARSGYVNNSGAGTQRIDQPRRSPATNQPNQLQNQRPIPQLQPVQQHQQLLQPPPAKKSKRKNATSLLNKTFHEMYDEFYHDAVEQEEQEQPKPADKKTGRDGRDDDEDELGVEFQDAIEFSREVYEIDESTDRDIKHHQKLIDRRQSASNDKV